MAQSIEEQYLDGVPVPASAPCPTGADPGDAPRIPYTRNKLHFLASSAVANNGRSSKVSVGASNVLQLLDVFTNLESEIRRLHVALGQQTEQVKRKQNRISTLDHRLRKARAARDVASLEAARLTEALEAIDCALDCAGHTPSDIPPGGGVPTRVSFDGPCFEAWPDVPDEWCAGCVAHIALISPAARS